MVKTDLTEEEKKLIIEALNSDTELPPELMTNSFMDFNVQYRKLTQNRYLCFNIAIIIQIILFIISILHYT